MDESGRIKEYFMLTFNFELNLKCLKMDNISKTRSGLTSVRFIGSLNLKIKNRELNQIRSV